MKRVIDSKNIAIVGLGQSGLSCVEFLAGRDNRVVVYDSNSRPGLLQELIERFPDVEFRGGSFDQSEFEPFDTIVISPGVDKRQPSLAKNSTARKIVGDIEIFAQEVSKPVIAVTGSNGKSTVVALLKWIFERAGFSVGLGGNFGTPALNLLQEKVDLYVLELSSFQLESTYSLAADVACILNVSEDHMDRYEKMQDYSAAKQRIYRNCKKAVFNALDEETRPVDDEVMQQIAFDDRKEKKGYWVNFSDLSLYRNDAPFLAMREMSLSGLHNLSNACAAASIAEQMNVAPAVVRKAIASFKGLPHRCEMIGEINGVQWINDSKGTNPGATIAALEGIGSTLNRDNKICLLLGGIGKGADFTQLRPAIKKYCRNVGVYGQDRKIIQSSLSGVVPCVEEDNLDSLIHEMICLAESGDVLLLSPACASFDQFSGYQERGEYFVQQFNKFNEQSGVMP